jgi:hypothetical protein
MKLSITFDLTEADQQTLNDASKQPKRLRPAQYKALIMQMVRDGIDSTQERLEEEALVNDGEHGA